MRERLRKTVVFSSVAAAATGIAVAGCVVMNDEAPADASQITAGMVMKDEAPADAAGAITAANVEPGTRTVVEGTFSERARDVSRSVSRTSLKSAKEKPADESAKEKPANESAKERSPDQASRGQAPRSEAPTNTDPRGIARTMLPEFGFAPSEFGCLNQLYVGESDWDVHADNPSSSAYGIPQAMMSVHELPADYTTNATTQIRWGLGYIRDSYGTPCAALDFKEANNYY